MMYGSEKWVLTKGSLRSIKSAEMECSRLHNVSNNNMVRIGRGKRFFSTPQRSDRL
jgi:hypothetical protein